jgi:hypothetical protein
VLEQIADRQQAELLRGLRGRRSSCSRSSSSALAKAVAILRS